MNDSNNSNSFCFHFMASETLVKKFSKMTFLPYPVKNSISFRTINFPHQKFSELKSLFYHFFKYRNLYTFSIHLLLFICY